jgi:hypothetical protein
LLSEIFCQGGVLYFVTVQHWWAMTVESSQHSDFVQKNYLIKEKLFDFVLKIHDRFQFDPIVSIGILF